MSPPGDDALTARELIKGRVLETAPVLPREAAAAVAEATGSEVVQVIGTRSSSSGEICNPRRSA